MKERGFTLIELLVVIAIVAVLAAILFPVFALAREKARSATCQSNLRQIGLAGLQYLQDFDEAYPPRYIDYSATGSPRIYWRALVQPYLSSGNATGAPNGVFVCPSSPWSSGTKYGQPAISEYVQVCDFDQDPKCAVRNAAGVLTGTACGGRGFVYHGVDSTLYAPMIPSPSASFWMGEAPLCSPKDNGKECVDNTDRMCQPESLDSAHYLQVNPTWQDHTDVSNHSSDLRHTGGLEYLFFDGHVKWMTSAQTVSPHNLWTATDTD